VGTRSSVQLRARSVEPFALLLNLDLKPKFSTCHKVITKPLRFALYVRAFLCYYVSSGLRLYQCMALGTTAMRQKSASRLYVSGDGGKHPLSLCTRANTSVFRGCITVHTCEHKRIPLLHHRAHVQAQLHSAATSPCTWPNQVYSSTASPCMCTSTSAFHSWMCFSAKLTTYLVHHSSNSRFPASPALS
jgi:hypothetical protein